ncbi:6-phosphofructokinase [Oricola thermophila]|uniref:ATP-dependent 6-phosphofructokinase n=1 Tax=Oricola thermophila TaxID=2742145 RepID=A0A6N1VDD7_9HYPH|nr:ATP-dependent 6-phosphofructokinase [Oricola thermophila]QKV17169.1 ATP-dependent 6-phosphofructokinase [Oricola thermophila]
MHLGILTGGGDVPGLNAAIKAVVNEACRNGWTVTGFRRGWAGPVQTDPDNLEATADHHFPLTPDFVRSINRSGGTILHSSRTRPSRMKASDVPPHVTKREPHADAGYVDATGHVLSVIEALKIDVLIAIGGDDTLSYAAELHEAGAPTMCIPKTMDNDVFGTDYCIGFSTCVTRSVEMINRLRTTAGSHERFLIVEMFGRNCGMSALAAGYLADADRTLIAEVPFELERLAELMTRDRDTNPSNYAVCVVSEGAMVSGEGIIEKGEADAYGHRKLGGIGERVGVGLKELTGTNMMIQNLGYLLRSGPPDAVDLIVAKNFGTQVVQLIEEGRTGLMVSISDGRYVTKPADISTRGEHRVDVAGMYDTQNYRPKISKVEGTTMYLR